MLEDESGRIRLVGEKIKQAGLVTGIIIAALGMETPAGDFEVIDYCFPGMAPQERDTVESVGEYMDVDYGKYLYSKYMNEYPYSRLQRRMEHRTPSKSGSQSYLD
jgi:DNA polymerase delta subunit 2